MKELIIKCIDKTYDWFEADGCGGWLRGYLVAIPLAAVIVAVIMMTSPNTVIRTESSPAAAICASRAVMARIISR